MSEGHIIRRTVDLKRLPEMSDEQRHRLEALASMPDEEIDTSDITDRTDRQWTRPGALIPQEGKKQVTLRIDSDVLAFFRSTGRRYQSRINAVLREYMRHQVK